MLMNSQWALNSLAEQVAFSLLLLSLSFTALFASLGNLVYGWLTFFPNFQAQLLYMIFIHTYVHSLIADHCI